ncbi:hypothetical protein GFV06_20565 [Salmonella enterica]|nr:hypothetical protein [Salmonella enterica]
MMILIITSSYDHTCDFLINKYPDASFFRLNTDYFYEYKISYGRDGFKIVNNNGESIASTDCSSIYYRKPANQDLENVIEPKYRNFIHKECISLIEGIADSFDGLCLSSPSKMRKADNKIIQASIAKKVGFKIPTFLIGNHSELIIKKDECDEKYIVKPLASGVVSDGLTKEFVQTNLYCSDMTEEMLKYSPVYFQVYQEKDYETRVTVVDGSFFCIRIDSDNKIDWRKQNNRTSYSVNIIPENVRINCLKYMECFDMKFGCFDFIIKNNVWYFLEMNANGQWLWLELVTGVEISAAIMKVLGYEV